MGFLVSQAFDYNQFIRATRSFVQGYPQLKKTNAMLPFDGIVITGTGTGELYIATNSGAVAGVSPGTAYRLTCTLGGGAGVATFSVKRDPTGANVNVGSGTLTADVRFRDATFGELIVRATTNWVIGDQINWSLVNSTLGAQAWTEDRFLEDLTADGNGNYVTEWITRGPGVGGGLNIHTAMHSQYNHAADRYNVSLYGQDGFASGSAINLQPNSNSITGTVTVPLICLRKATPMPFWLVSNGDRHAAAIKAGSVFQWYYQGFLAIHGTPGNHALPMFIGGCHTQSTAVTGSVDAPHRAFWDPTPHASTGSSAHFRWVDGTWIRTINNTDTAGSRGFAKSCVMLPYSSYIAGNESPLGSFTGFMLRVKPALGTSEYEVFPITLAITTPQSAIVGDLIGIRAVSGFSQASENLVTIGGQTWFVGQNTFRSGRDNFAALLLE